VTLHNFLHLIIGISGRTEFAAVLVANSGATAWGNIPMSDPNSHYGSDGSYNLYTQNETKAATDFMLGAGVAILTGGTGLAAGIGEGTVAVATKVINNPWTIPVIQFLGGLGEGIIKSYLGPDPEISSSIFNNHFSNLGLNTSGIIINALNIENKNPFPVYP